MGADEAEFAVGGADFDDVAVFHGDHDLAIDGETDLVVGVTAVGVDADRYLAVAGDDDGAHGEVGGTDWGEDEAVDAGMDDGAAGAEGVTGGTGGRGDDDAVRFELNHLSLVDFSVERDETSKVTLIDHGLV